MILSKRIFDLFIITSVGILFFLPMVLIAICIKINSKGPILYWSERVGKNNTLFLMPKFRSMKIGTPTLATHLLNDPDHYLTSVGRVLRKTSLDELPQIWSILKGEMSLVGPRPALFNQYDLIEMRSRSGVNSIIPGLTGWAQVNGRDELSVEEKNQLDVEYLKKQSISLDIYILWLTIIKVLTKDGISH